jgi:hypothetical protein
LKPVLILIVVGVILALVGVIIQYSTDDRSIEINYAMPLMGIGIPMIVVPVLLKLRKITRNL